MSDTTLRNFGIIGGGPAALFMVKRLLEANEFNIHISIFEKNDSLGAGMPYSEVGANPEHITNVSDNEIPPLQETMKEWLEHAPSPLLQQYHITPQSFNEYKVVPRLLFGAYLTAQFDALLQQAKRMGIEVEVHYQTLVTDVVAENSGRGYRIITADEGVYHADTVIICTGHQWPKKYEDKVPGWFDSPYPPAKLSVEADHPVAIRGASLTAIDAVRTLARRNGIFTENEDGILSYVRNHNAPGFRMVLHSLEGLLPAIRFHLEDSHLSKDSVLSEEEVQQTMQENEGFIPLDYIFERNFKQPLQQRNPEFYEKISGMQMEDFVQYMMSFRESMDPMLLFKGEFAEAEKSIRRRQAVDWKEELAVLSYAMNYPAKHLSAEDMLRLKKVLMPLIAIVIAFVPQGSCKEIIALYDAGVLEIVPVSRESRPEPAEAGGAIYHHTNEGGQPQEIHYPLFVDAVGQPHFPYSAFPFESLRRQGYVSPARLKFRDAPAASDLLADGNEDITQDAAGDYWLQVPGIGINDAFQVLDQYGAFNEQLFIMAVPHIGGLNPDYSGLDFCERASQKIAEALFPKLKEETAAL